VSEPLLRQLPKHLTAVLVSSEATSPVYVARALAMFLKLLNGADARQFASLRCGRREKNKRNKRKLRQNSAPLTRAAGRSRFSTS